MNSIFRPVNMPMSLLYCFNSMKMLSVAAATLAEMIFHDGYDTDGPSFKRDRQELYTAMGMILEDNSSMLSIYFTFNIDKGGLKDEIWLRHNKEGKATDILTGIVDLTPKGVFSIVWR